MRKVPSPQLVPVSQTLRNGAGLPPSFYLVLKKPAPLAGCAFPFPGDFVDWDLIHRAGFRHVFCVSSEAPRYNPAPLKLAVACELDDLSMRKRPVAPKREAENIIQIAELVVESLRKKQGVLIHCAAGRGRTGSVMGVALRLLGHPADKVIEHLNAIHVARSDSPWPESPWQSDLVSREY